MIFYDNSGHRPSTTENHPDNVISTVQFRAHWLCARTMARRHEDKAPER
jgi:hypothetical protein